MSHHHDVCDTCLKVWCRCNDTPVQPQPTPGALTRYDDPDYRKQVSLQMLATPTHEIACRAITDLRATITQQAQELEQVKKERDAFQVGQLEVAKFLGYGVGAQLSLQSFIMQQLTASQARCREVEEELKLSETTYSQGYNQVAERNAQLQATLAAREAEVYRLKLAQQHSIQDECEAEQRLIDAGISDYEDGGQGEYRGLLTQIDLCIKERDAAVQQLNGLRGKLKDE